MRGSDVVVIAGAAVIDEGGYDNVMVTISGEGSEIVYRQRMPVPGSMWRPWLPWTGQTGGAGARFFANPVATVAHVRIAPLICYELLLVWPVLHSMLHQPDIIVAIGNGWWTKGANIVANQKASTEAWASLFDVPLVMAFNH